MSTHLYLVKALDSIDDHLINKAISFLPPDIRKKIKSFYHIEDSIRSLLGYMMLKKVFPQFDQYTNSLSFTKYGKPFIQNQDLFHFNISHSKSWVVLAVSKDEIGVDIEYIKPVCFDTMKGALTEEEYTKLQSLPNYEAVKCFYKIWTVKESFLKMIGIGLSLSPNHLQTNVYIEEPTILLDGKQQNVMIQTFQIESNYQISVCGKGMNHIQKMEIFHAGKLLRDLTKEKDQTK